MCWGADPHQRGAAGRPAGVLRPQEGPRGAAAAAAGAAGAEVRTAGQDQRARLSPRLLLPARFCLWEEVICVVS